MVNQGRLIKVMFLLVGAMTGGALVLLGLEGKPIKPMAFSLSSQARLAPVYSVLSRDVGVEMVRWQSIEFSYRPEGEKLSTRFGPTGSLVNSYHFIISDGSVGDDGQIYPTPRWRRQEPCRNSDGTPVIPGAIRICLISSESHPMGTPRQNNRLDKIANNLLKNCRISPNNIVFIE